MTTLKTGWIKCPICHARLKADKFRGHLKNVHPKGAETREERNKIVGARRSVKKVTSGILVGAVSILIVVTIIFTYYHLDIRGTKMGDKPYNFTLQATDGTKFTLDDFLGTTPILFGMMSTECLHCMKECDVFQDVYANYSDRLEITIMFSNEHLQNGQLTQMSDVQNRAETHNLQFTVLFDKNSRVYNKYTSDMVQGFYPMIFIINKEGKIAWTNKYTDPQTGYYSYDELASKLDTVCN